MSDEPYPDWAFDDMNAALDAAVVRAEAAEARVRVLEEALRYWVFTGAYKSRPPEAEARAAHRALLPTPAPVEMPGDVHPQGE